MVGKNVAVGENTSKNNYLYLTRREHYIFFDTLAVAIWKESKDSIEITLPGELMLVCVWAFNDGFPWCPSKKSSCPSSWNKYIAVGAMGHFAQGKVVFTQASKHYIFVSIFDLAIWKDMKNSVEIVLPSNLMRVSVCLCVHEPLMMITHGDPQKVIKPK